MRRNRANRAMTGETRIVKRFLFLPTTIGYETRWLEFASIKQYCDHAESYWFPWFNEKFID